MAYAHVWFQGCLFFLKQNQVTFHASLKGPGLLNTPNAPHEFRDFMKCVCAEWDFDNLITAHNGNLIGNAKQVVLQLIEDHAAVFDALHDRNAGKGGISILSGSKGSVLDDWLKDPRNGTDCG